MKKIITLFFILTGLSFVAISQKPIAEIWTQPAVFKADEKVALFFDVSGTSLAGSSEDIYLWSWTPSEPDAGNWANSSDFAKLTNVEENIWKIEMTPTEYYGVAANNISAIYGLLKNKNGSKTTEEFAPDKETQKGINIILLDNISGDLAMEHFPKEYQHKRPLSILINTKNTWSGCDATATQGAINGTTELYLVPECNNGAVKIEFNEANKSKLKFIDLGNGIFKFDMMPDDFFNNPLPWVYNIKFHVTNADNSKVGSSTECADFMIGSAKEPEIPIPVLSFFPQKFSQKDIIRISRKNNEEGVNNLSFTISANGVADITGDFEGSNSEFTAFVNLASGLKAVKNLEKIHLLIKDNKGRTVADTDLQLVVNQ